MRSPMDDVVCPLANRHPFAERQATNGKRSWHRHALLSTALSASIKARINRAAIWAF
jgi:hypothetical protein